MQQQSIAVFRNQLLSTATAPPTDMASSIISESLSVTGNKAVVSLTVINITAASSPVLTIQVQGSINGSAWVDLLTTALTTSAFGYSQDIASLVDLSYPFVRVSAVLTSGGTDTVLFDVTLGFSDQ